MTPEKLKEVPRSTAHTAPTASFRADEAFKRNLGLISHQNMDRLAASCVAIAGLGGMGGAHVELLARQGIGIFKLADMDTFNLVNMNRQFGATMRTLGRPKIDVMRQRIQEINPSARLDLFPKGISRANMAQFLDGTNVVIDALDFFEIDLRRALFSEAYKRNIPVITAGPVGFGAAMQVVVPGGMTFDEFYDMTDDLSPEEKLIRFVVGISPQAFHQPYLDINYVNVAKKYGPSSSIGIALAAGLAETEVLRILLEWDGVKGLPYYTQCDARRRRWYKGKLSGGNKSMIQRIKMWFLRRQLALLLSKAEAQPLPTYRFFKD